MIVPPDKALLGPDGPVIPKLHKGFRETIADMPLKYHPVWNQSETNGDMMNQSENVNELFAALAKAQSKITTAFKGEQGFNYKYADLAACLKACRDQLAENNLCVVQTTEKSENGQTVTVITTLGHSSGQWMRGYLTLKPTKADPQGIGSAITYARRYALNAMVGIAADDDDGAAASRGEPEQTKRPNVKRLNPSEQATVVDTPAVDPEPLPKPTEQQWGKLGDMLDQVDIELQDWLDMLGVSNPASVPAQDFSEMFMFLDLLISTKTLLEDVLQYYKVDSFAALGRDNFSEARRMLQTKKLRNASRGKNVESYEKDVPRVPADFDDDIPQ